MCNFIYGDGSRCDTPSEVEADRTKESVLVNHEWMQNTRFFPAKEKEFCFYHRKLAEKLMEPSSVYKGSIPIKPGEDHRAKWDILDEIFSKGWKLK